MRPTFERRVAAIPRRSWMTLAPRRPPGFLALSYRVSISSARSKFHDVSAPSLRQLNDPGLHRRHAAPQRRTFLTSTLQSLPPYALAPTVFTGLLVTLWLYKCLMTIIFQEKIIYMPYMPPFTRSEKVEDYAASCKPVTWTEIEMRAGDGVRVGGVVGRIEDEGRRLDDDVGAGEKAKARRKHVMLCYFHGNGGSLPPRLPMLSNVLKAIHSQSLQHPAAASEVEYTLAALSYRGYWTSSGRPSQAGIELDAQALLRWVNDIYPTETELILWGQSIGAGVGTTAAATYARAATEKDQIRLPVVGLVLETPFTSIKSMLLALYPQKWLPYRYLGPFLRSHWDSEAALSSLAATTVASKQHTPRVLILAAGKDEIVPAGEAEKLEGVCRAEGLEVERREVRGALHNDATVKKEGRDGVVGFIVKLAEEKEG